MRSRNLIFLIWVTGLAVFVFVTGMLTRVNPVTRIFQILFIPVPFYLTLTLVSRFIKNFSPLEGETGLERIIVYYSFVYTTVMVIVGFLSSRTIPQYVTSLVFAHLPFYFLLLIWPKSAYRVTYARVDGVKPKNHPLESILEPKTKIDTDRRDFLKLIGTVGVTAFVFNLFAKRGIPFFANTGSNPSLTGSGGYKSSSAENSVADGYFISQIDDFSPISYFGFINEQGNWYIMKQNVDGSFRYARGDSSFSDNWVKRSSLNYDYFNHVF